MGRRIRYGARQPTLWRKGSSKNNGVRQHFCLGESFPAPALVLTPDNSVPSHLSLAPSELLSRRWNSELASPIKSERRPFKRHSPRFRQRFSLPQPSSPAVFAAGSCGDFSCRHWNPGLGTWCGPATPHSSGGTSAAELSTRPPILTHHTWVGDQRLLVSAPPTSLDVDSS